MVYRELSGLILKMQDQYGLQFWQDQYSLTELLTNMVHRTGSSMINRIGEPNMAYRIGRTDTVYTRLPGSILST